MDGWIAKQHEEIRRIKEEGVSPQGVLAPFHDALVPGIRGLGERSFSTSLGNVHEQIAQAIGKASHADARRAFDLTGELPVLAREFITQRVAALRSAAVAPDHDFERSHLLETFGATVVETTRIDLWITTHDGVDHYFEMKSAKPNNGQCVEMKTRLLTALGIRRQPSVHVAWAVPVRPVRRLPPRMPTRIPSASSTFRARCLWVRHSGISSATTARPTRTSWRCIARSAGTTKPRSTGSAQSWPAGMHSDAARTRRLIRRTPAGETATDVEAHVELLEARIAREPGRRRAAQAPLLLLGDHLLRVAEARAALLLHLAEDEVAAAADDEVELVAARPGVHVEDPVAAEPVVESRAALGLSPALPRVHGAARPGSRAPGTRAGAPRTGRAARTTAECSGRDVADVRAEAVVRVERVHAGAWRGRASTLATIDAAAIAAERSSPSTTAWCGGAVGPSRKPSTRQTSAGGDSACSAARSPARFERCSPSRSIRQDENTCTDTRVAHSSTARKSRSRSSCESCFESFRSASGRTAWSRRHAVVEQHAGDDERPRERPAAGLVGARDEARAEPAVEAEEPLAGARHEGRA